MENIFVKFLLVGLCAGAVLSRQVNSVKNGGNNGTASPRDGLAVSTNYTQKVKGAPCHYSDPKVADCIREITEQARFILAAGLPEKEIQPMEPLKIPSLRMRQHNAPKSGFKYDAWLSGVSIRGLTNFTFNSLDVYPEKMLVDANISLPSLRLSGEYVIIGDFQMLPVESVGNMVANFTNCTAHLVALSARVNQRMVVKDANVKLSCAGQTKVDLENTQFNSKDMELITNHIAAMHSADITRELEPAVETSLGMVLEDVANKFLKHVSADDIFAD